MMEAECFIQWKLGEVSCLGLLFLTLEGGLIGTKMKD